MGRRRRAQRRVGASLLVAGVVFGDIDIGYHFC